MESVFPVKIGYRLLKAVPFLIHLRFFPISGLPIVELALNL